MAISSENDLAFLGGHKHTANKTDDPTATEVMHLKEVIAKEMYIGKEYTDIIHFDDGKFEIETVYGYDYITLEDARKMAEENDLSLAGYNYTTILTDETAEAQKELEENPLFDKGVQEMIRENAIERQFEGYNKSMFRETARKKAIEKHKEKRAEQFHAFEKGLLFDDWEEYQKLRSDNQMGEEEKWTVYEVVIVDKEKPELLTMKGGEYHVSKTPEMALGKAGYYDMLEKKGHDDTKLKKKVVALTDVRPVEDDE